MQNVPKIVRERLKAATPAVNHPEADVLTAFAEHSLAERERAFVLKHLGSCSDCRDIVALALPAMEPVETAMRAPERGWLTWPALRWGLVAAGVIAIAALGIAQYQRRPSTIATQSGARFEVAGKEAKNQPLAPPVPAATAKKADNIPSPGVPPIGDSVDATNATVDEPTRITQAAPSGVPSGRSAALAVARPLAHGPRMADQWQQQKAVQNQLPAPSAPSPFAKQAAGDLSAKMRVPAATETVAVGAQSAQLETQDQNLSAQQIGASRIKDLPSGSGGDFALARAKPATQTAGNSAPASTMAAPTPSETSGGSALTLFAPAARWIINSTGGLQRSFDQGTTWQAVNVNANPASFSDAASLQITGKTSRSKVRKLPSPVFRAVAATGTDVWAGGSGGALYHSPDAGDHWIRVMPASAGTMLTGDVVSLEFSDTQHGKVSTSTAELWTTSDDGQTWQKQ